MSMCTVHIPLPVEYDRLERLSHFTDGRVRLHLKTSMLHLGPGQIELTALMTCLKSREVKFNGAIK